MSDDKLYSDAQRLLVSSLLYDSSEIDRVLIQIGPDDLSDPQMFLIMTAMANLARRDVKVTVVTVAGELEEYGNLAKAGDIVHLKKLADEGLSASLDHSPVIYAMTVKELSAKYRTKGSIEEARKFFSSDSGYTAKAGISYIQNVLDEEMLRLSDDSNLTTMRDFMPTYMDILKQREEISVANQEHSEGLQGIPTMLPTLNKYTSGFMPEKLITVGARTGIGKTVFAVMSALSAAQAGKSVLFFSLEMNGEEVSNRLVAASSGVGMSRLKSGILSDFERDQVTKSINELAEMKIEIDASPSITMDEIRSRALRKAQSSEGLDMIVIDYLQLIQSSRKSNSRQEEVADLSRSMKVLAKSLKVPIISLCQLRRPSDKEEKDSPPTINEIRESGAIAQDSDMVILLHREETQDGELAHTHVMLVKNRDGVSNRTIRCHSNLAYSLLTEVTKESDVSDSLSEEEIEELEGSLELGYLGDLDEDIMLEDL